LTRGIGQLKVDVQKVDPKKSCLLSKIFLAKTSMLKKTISDMGKTQRTNSRTAKG
jgi:hypothetical protein